MWRAVEFDGLRLAVHQVANRLDDLQLVGEELVGRDLLEVRDESGCLRNEGGVRVGQRMLRAEDHDVLGPDWDDERVRGPVRADDAGRFGGLKSR